MYCTKCGTKFNENEKFCSKCGNQINNYGVNLISMRCKDCDGLMTVDSNNKFIICPYCGSKKLIVESDYVKVETAKSHDSRLAKETESFFDYKKEEIKGKWDSLETIAMLIAICFLLLLMRSYT